MLSLIKKKLLGSGWEFVQITCWNIMTLGLEITEHIPFRKGIISKNLRIVLNNVFQIILS